MSRFDIVIYGATGFTGMYIVGVLAKSPYFEGLSVAVAGRNKSKIEEALDTVSNRIGKDIRSLPVIIANSDDPESLAQMAKQAKVIINAVGPYRLYGEPVVKAAVENGASHLDISGEIDAKPNFVNVNSSNDSFAFGCAYIERMAVKYGDLAKEKGVYVVSACGWDSIPNDLGFLFLKQNFDGDLTNVESFVEVNYSPQGYALADGTYQSALLHIAEGETREYKENKKKLMPNPLPKGPVPNSKRVFFKKQEKSFEGWSVPFTGADPEVVERSQYYFYHENNERPAHVNIYVKLPSLTSGVLLGTWLVPFFVAAKIPPTRRFLQKYPDCCSFGLFSKKGPTPQQIAGTTFSTYLVGTGYSEKLPTEQEHEGEPNKKMIVICHGPDPGYMGTSGCIISCALALIKDADKLPKNGGVFTTASAFRNTNIFEYLKSFNVTFRVEETTQL